MAQTEMMLRLLKDGKIVGHEHLCLINGLIQTAPYWGGYDSFELGIKDWFEGDIFKVTYSVLATKHKPYTQFIGGLNYLEMLGLWTISDIDNENEVDYQDQFNGEFDLEHLGNIHDNPELLKESNGK